MNTTTTPAGVPALDELKTGHRATWAAGDYTAVADAFVLEIGERAVDAAIPVAGLRVLDVATGSGSAAIPAAHAGARVTGLDLVPELLATAEGRARDAGIEAEWIEGDAEALPFADASFDVALSVLGVQFAPHHEVAARELARVLRDGGRLVLASWTPAGFIGRVFKTMAPYMPAPPPAASPPPLWGDADHVRALFAATGVEFEFSTGSVDFECPSAEAFVAFMETNYGPILKARERLSADGRWDDLRNDLLDLARESDIGEGGFRAPSQYLLARGIKG